MNKDFYIYLKLKPYVRQWLTNAYGDPVKFNAHSVENAELRRWLIPVPDGCMPLLPEDGATPVVIPQSKRRDPATYNYLTAEARECLVSMIDNNFDSDLKHSVRRSVCNGASYTHALRAWMRLHSIDIDHEETLLKRIQRMISSYKKKNLNFFTFDLVKEGKTVKDNNS